MNAQAICKSAVLSGAALLVLGVSGCDSDSTRVERVPPEEFSIVISEQLITLDVGELVSLEATVVDETGAARLVDVVWESANPEVATVDANGLITAQAPGYANIRVRVMRAPPGVQVSDAHVEVRVRNDVASIVLIPGIPIELEVGDTMTIRAVVKSVNGERVNRTLLWFTDHQDVISVGDHGLVTALEPGTALVTAEASETVSASMSVSVVPRRGGG